MIPEEVIERLKEMSLKKFSCPDCGYEQHCPCEHCKDKLPEGKIPWTQLDGDLIRCSKCGYTAHCDKWLDYEWDYYKSHEALTEAIRLIEEYRQRQVSIYEILHNLEKNGWEIPKEIDEWWKKETYLNEARKD